MRVLLLVLALLGPMAAGATRYRVPMDKWFTAWERDALPFVHDEAKTAIARIPLDPHITGPLLGEIEAAIACDHPHLHVVVREVYDDCNLCSLRSDGMCTLMGCDAQWWTFLFLKKRDPDGPVTVTVTPSRFVFDWTEEEMRARWRATRGNEPPRYGAEAFFPRDGDEAARPPDRPPLADDDEL